MLMMVTYLAFDHPMWDGAIYSWILHGRQARKNIVGEPYAASQCLTILCLFAKAAVQEKQQSLRMVTALV